MTLCFAYFATESVSEPREGVRAAEAATPEPGSLRPGTTAYPAAEADASAADDASAQYLEVQ
jgi:hypothetical protein